MKTSEQLFPRILVSIFEEGFLSASRLCGWQWTAVAGGGGESQARQKAGQCSGRGPRPEVCVCGVPQSIHVYRRGVGVSHTATVGGGVTR